ncbi:uncharacterized protein VICG_00971 [Vittaforma corneae ATCC 50505]|uniref:Zinc-ribbon 15 domain-containing protein n=1 Tax=Vittaforma corneae (strain ATCC 50505) TaxID=993615 RepID=L2GMU0_VITCO|nr:uncharacterized protein VICG_00971 [Vittaforma corneae ATCC 50505]ELA41954.1 hypothetical protein VICG_00971 [Vittaforma corneae ATCC 50505]
MCMMFLGILRPNRVDTHYETINAPPGFETPPEKILCSRCGHITNAVYRKTYKNCVCFFVPCPWVETGEPFLACSRCNMPLEHFPQKECISCQTLTTFKSDYCPICGGRKEMPTEERG